MRLAVYHDVTLDLLGSLDAREYPEIQCGPMVDGRSFELRACERVPFAYATGAATAATLTRIAFRPLILKNRDTHTFALFVDCNSRDLEKVRGFRPL